MAYKLMRCQVIGTSQGGGSSDPNLPSAESNQMARATAPSIAIVTTASNRRSSSTDASPDSRPESVFDFDRQSAAPSPRLAIGRPTQIHWLK
jgi:hypothetical protein